MSHVATNNRQGVPVHGALDFGDAARVRGQLRLQIGDILVGVARWVSG